MLSRVSPTGESLRQQEISDPAAEFAGFHPMPSFGNPISPLFGYVILRSALAAGESLTIDVLDNGGSLLTAPLALTAASAVGVPIPLPYNPAAAPPGGTELVSVQGTYVAGGGPANPGVYLLNAWKTPGAPPNFMPL